MALSLVVCTRNRVAHLSQLLATVDAADRPESFELVVVDNGSDDDTARCCRDFASRASYPVLSLHEPVVGLGRARNAGWRAASGSIVAFTDDDCRLTRGHLRAQLRLMLTLGADILGGAVVPPSSHAGAVVPAQARVALLESRALRWFPGSSQIRPGELQGANLAFRREVLQRIGGFDERLGAGTPYRCEDIDAVARALQAGFAALYAPSLAVVHAHGRTAQEGRALEAANDRARGAYYAARLGSGQWPFMSVWLDSLQGRFGRHPRTWPTAGRVAARELGGAMSYLCHDGRSRPRAMTTALANNGVPGATTAR